MNKNLILTAIIFLTFTSVMGQTNVYHPFPDSNAVWCGEEGGFNGVNYVDIHFSEFINNDSTIGLYTYHKLYKTGYELVEIPPFVYYSWQNVFSGLYREDISHRKVYVYQDGQDTLLYDFNLALYDTLPESICNSDKNFVSSIDSVLIDNSYRKRFWLSMVDYYGNIDSAYVALIEGVGSTFGFNEWLVPPFEWGAYLNSFSDSVAATDAPSFCGVLGLETHELMNETIMQVYPNPFSTVTTINIRNEVNKSNLIIFNTLGQEIKEIKGISSKEIRLDRDDMPSGIYFLQLIKENRVLATKKIIIIE